MTCAAWQDLLDEGALHTLEDAPRAALEAHAATCPHCGPRVATERLLAEAWSDQRRLQPSARLQAALLAVPRRGQRLRAYSLWVVPVSMLVIGLLALLEPDLLRRQRRAGRPAGAADVRRRGRRSRDGHGVLLPGESHSSPGSSGIRGCGSHRYDGIRDPGRRPPDACPPVCPRDRVGCGRGYPAACARFRRRRQRPRVRAGTRPPPPRPRRKTDRSAPRPAPAHPTPSRRSPPPTQAPTTPSPRRKPAAHPPEGPACDPARPRPPRRRGRLAGNRNRRPRSRRPRRKTRGSSRRRRHRRRPPKHPAACRPSSRRPSHLPLPPRPRERRPAPRR